jgi:hypothetical protein
VRKGSGLQWITQCAGDIYKGAFKEGVMHGPGSYHFDKPKCQFTGTFERGAFTNGRWVLLDGSYCQSTFTPDEHNDRVFVPSGEAVRYFDSAGLIQDGVYKDGTWIGRSVKAA